MHPRTRKRLKRRVLAGGVELALLVGISAFCFVGAIVLGAILIEVGKAIGLLA